VTVLAAAVVASVVTGLVDAPGVGATPGAAATTSTLGAGVAQPATRPAAGSGPSSPLTLSAQTAFVTPGQAFDVRLRPGSGTPPVADLAFTVSVYACLSSVSAFDQSVSSASGPPGTRISSTPSPVPLGGLPVSQGVFDLLMPVTTGTAAVTPPAGGFAIDLTAAGAQCGAYPSGVYPVRIELIDTASGQAIGGLTTHLVYTDPSAGTEKLRVAVVLPVRTTLRPAAAPSPGELRARPSAALAPPTTSAVDSVTGTVNVIAEHPTVPVTLEASPQTIALLGSTGHQGTLSQLASLAATPGFHQIADSPYVPVDASSLVDAGLQTELGLQVAQGIQVLDANVTHPTAAQVTESSPGHLGTWFTDTALDPATLAQLQTDGYDQLVLPAGSVSTAPTNGSTAEPFSATTAKGTPMTALASNSDVTSRFSSASADPVLAAHQLVAEMAQMYYEKPNDTTVRGILAVAPGGWSDNPAFVDALLAALQDNPIVQAVTTATLFTALGPASSCRGGCRLTSSTGQNGLPATAIRNQRQRINGLVLAAPTTRQGVGVQLSEVVLSGQAEDLRPGQQAGIVTNASAAINAQLAQIAVAGDRTITLTSQRGRVPVTIVSAAPYPVRGELTLTSDKLLFANHATSVTLPVTLTAATPAHANVVYVNVQARASGIFKVDVVLRSPVGGMVLSSGQVSVRSTATSVVGIVLSLGAVAVLAAWWIRTSRKRRRARRAGPPIEVPAEPVTTG
jgi:hypothetical protein